MYSILCQIHLLTWTVLWFLQPEFFWADSYSHWGKLPFSTGLYLKIKSILPHSLSWNLGTHMCNINTCYEYLSETSEYCGGYCDWFALPVLCYAKEAHFQDFVLATFTYQVKCCSRSFWCENRTQLVFSARRGLWLQSRLLVCRYTTLL